MSRKGKKTMSTINKLAKRLRGGLTGIKRNIRRAQSTRYRPRH